MGHAKKGKGNTIADAIYEAWSDTLIDNSEFEDYIYDPYSGSIVAPPNYDFAMECPTGPDAYSPGTYEFYTSKPIDYNSWGINTNYGSKSISFVGEENGLYRYSFTLSQNCNITAIATNNSTTEPVAIWFISKREPQRQIQITIKGIDFITGFDGSSIDGSNIEPPKPDRALVTQKYVDARQSLADEITLTRSLTDPITVKDSDMQTVLNSAWSPNIITTGWYKPDEWNYSNGRFTFPANTSVTAGIDRFLRNDSDSPVNGEVRYVRFLTNIDWEANGFYLIISDNVNRHTDIRSFHQEQTESGLYVITTFIGGGMDINILEIANLSTLSEDLWIEFIDYDLYPPKQSFKIKNINYIIDDDGESIDGSDTPMSDPHSELVTRGYVESYVGNLAYWTKRNNPTGFGQELTPTDTNVKRVGIYNTDRGINEFFIQNDNSSDNYTGASITLTTSNTNYDSQMFLSYYGPNFYIPHLANRGSIYTDSSMYIGAYNTVDKQGEDAFVAFVVGDDWNNQKEIFRLTANGLEMPLQEKKFWYANGQNIQNHPETYTQLFCNVDTSEVYAGVPNTLAPVRVITKNNITLNGLQNIDGVDLQDGDRVAVFNQDDGTQNGIYIAKDGANWERANDMHVGIAVGGSTFIVMEGSLTNADTQWLITNDRGSDVVGTDVLQVKAIGNEQTLDSIVSVRLLESVFNIDLSNPPSQIDYTDVNDGDIVCLSAQTNEIENGFYLVDSVNGWSRAEIMPVGTHIQSVMFIVNEGCLNADTIWLFTNDKPTDVVGTDKLYMIKVSSSGYVEKTEQFVISSVDESNQFVQLSYVPVTKKHIIVSVNGEIQAQGNGFDYEVNDDRIVFYSPIEQGDQVVVKYSYKPGDYCVPPKPPSPYFEFDIVIHNQNEDFNIYYIELANDADQIEIDWGDGVTETYGASQTNLSHTYSDVGTKRVRILGHDWIRFSDGNTVVDKDITVANWGLQNRWVRFNGMFAYMSNIKINIIGVDDLAPTNPVSMEDIFRNSPNFNSDISGWDISNVTTLKNAFNGAAAFNQPIGNWDVSNVTDMYGTFANVHDFNKDISNWDVSNVTDMSYMFYNAYAFNKDISAWDTSNVTKMDYMFAESDNFNQNITSWNVDSVTSCEYFRQNSALDCDNAPVGLPAACTGCFNDFKFNVTVNANDTITLNIGSKGDTDLIIDWGDGTIDNLGTNYNSAKAHTYTAGGTFLVKIHGHRRLRLPYGNSTNQFEIVHWGDNRAWSTVDRMFYNVKNVTLNVDDVLSPTNLVSAYGMFDSSTNFNSPVDSIDTKNFTNTANMFKQCNSFNQSVSHFDTSNVTDMSYMFDTCQAFNQDLSNFNTANVTNMAYMFNNCTAFNGDVTSFNTTNVTDMSYMFNNCWVFNQPIGNWDVSNVTSLRNFLASAVAFNQPLNSWNVSNVTNMDSTFYCAKSFNQDLNNWNVSKVTTMRRMFGCYIDNSMVFNGRLDNWDLMSCTNIQHMFWNCYQFNQNLNTWQNTNNIQIMTATFFGCDVFNQPLNNWDTSSVTDLNSTFYNCYQFNQDLDNWVVDNVTTMYSTFTNCHDFNGNVSTWNPKNCTDMTYTFAYCYDFDKDLSNWDVSNVTSMQRMFFRASSFNGAVTNWNTASLTNMREMFRAASMFNQPVDHFNVSGVTSMYAVFRDANSFNQPLNSWDVSNVTDLTSMFYNAKSFDQPLNNWNTSKVTLLKSTFLGCTNFNNDISTWDVSNVTDMSNTFYNCTNFNSDLSNWNTSSVTTLYQTFYGSGFNSNISGWNVSNVTNMTATFRGAKQFNQPLNTWVVDNVTNMNSMFYDTAFNQPLNDWNTSKVNDMGGLFGLSPFNQDISNWDVSKVTNFANMFYKSGFNNPLNGWDTSSAINMSGMFSGNAVFNQDISNFDVSNVTTFVSFLFDAKAFGDGATWSLSNWNTGSAQDMTNMFRNTINFDQDISGWDISNVSLCGNFRNGSALTCAHTPALPSSCTGC